MYAYALNLLSALGVSEDRKHALSNPTARTTEPPATTVPNSVLTKPNYYDLAEPAFQFDRPTDWNSLGPPARALNGSPLIIYVFCETYLVMRAVHGGMSLHLALNERKNPVHIVAPL